MGCGASGPKPLTLEEMIQGLKDTLGVAVRLATDQLGAAGGFFNNPALKIEIPTVLGDIMSAARDLPGIGEKVVEFEQKLNSGAEKACKAAVQTFIDAINGMNFKDAKAVLEGPPTGATSYFKDTLSEPLREKFLPIIDNALKDEGVVVVLDGIIMAWQAAEAVKDAAANAAAAAQNALGSLMGGGDKVEEPPKKEAPPCDVADYVCTKGLDGLWSVLAEKEQAVRGGAAHHTTDAMKRCYAKKQ